MSKIKKLVYPLAVMIFAVLALLSSCDKNDLEPVVPQQNERVLETSTRAVSGLTNNELPYTPYYGSYNSYAVLDLSGYTHFNESSQTIGICGAATYMVGRHLKYGSSYSVSSQEVNKIYAGGRSSLADFYYYKSIDKVNSYLERVNAVNNIYKGREEIKKFIKQELDAGNPVMVPAIYDAETNPNSNHLGHFYLIVGVYLKSASNTNYGGPGSVIAVKDVWCGNNCPSNSFRTMYYDYMQFLNSMWYQSQRTQGIGSEFYLALSFRNK